MIIVHYNVFSRLQKLCLCNIQQCTIDTLKLGKKLDAKVMYWKSNCNSAYLCCAVPSFVEWISRKSNCEGVYKKSTTGTVQDRIARLLFQYRITPHTTTSLSPSEMLVGRKLRSKLDLLKPDLQQKVQEKQLRQKVNRDKRSRPRHFEEGESVFAKYFGPGERWIPGKIVGRKLKVLCRLRSSYRMGRSGVIIRTSYEKELCVSRMGHQVIMIIWIRFGEQRMVRRIQQRNMYLTQ